MGDPDFNSLPRFLFQFEMFDSLRNVKLVNFKKYIQRNYSIEQLQAETLFSKIIVLMTKIMLYVQTPQNSLQPFRGVTFFSKKFKRNVHIRNQTQKGTNFKEVKMCVKVPSCLFRYSVKLNS